MVFSKKKIGAIVAIVGILAIIVIILAINSKTKRTAMLVFEKDNQLHFMYASKDKSVELTNQLYAEADKKISPAFVVADNAKKVFYSANINDRAFDLYYRNVKKDKAVKIASNVSSFEVSSDGKMVYYIADKALYSYDMKESNKIADDVSRFIVSDNGKKLLYIATDKYDLYYKNGKKDAKNIASGASLISATDDFKKMAYVSSGSLYTFDGKDKTECIGDNVETYILYDEDNIVYITSHEYAIKYSEIINDTLKNEKAPNVSSDEYVNYKIRQNVRAQVLSNPDMKYEYTVRELNYYNGVESAVVKPNFGTIATSNIDEMQIVYTSYDGFKVPKIDITSFNEYNGIELKADIDNYIRSILYGKPTYNVMIGDANYPMSGQSEKISQCALKNDGSAFYFLLEGILYEQKISGRRIKKSSVYAENVASVTTYPYCDEIVYVKNFNPEKNRGSLYIGEKLVDNEVFLPGGSLRYVEINDKSVGYLYDYDYTKKTGTLKYFNGKKNVTIKDNIEYGKYMILADDRLAYLDNQTLYIADEKDNKKISDGVKTIFRYVYSDNNKKAYYK